MSQTEMGEFLVGAYLKLVEKCDVVDYNVRPPGGGLKGLNELDVVGFRFSDNVAFLCEVTTHVRGVLCGDGYAESLERIQKKHKNQVEYAERHLSHFPNRRYQFWAPVVPVGKLYKSLLAIDGLDLVVNGEYKHRVRLLQEMAGLERQDTGNPVFRVLQILLIKPAVPGCYPHMQLAPYSIR